MVCTHPTPEQCSAVQAGLVLLTAVSVWLVGNLAARGQGWLTNLGARDSAPVMAQFDPKLGIAAVQASLNLYFAPRWFEADREGRLVWLGKDAEAFPEGVRSRG